MSALFSTPKPPDPVKTAAAQTATNVSTALANARLNMTDQIGPNGSKTYREIGTQMVKDPSTGVSYSVPRYEEKTSLTPMAKMANDSSQQTQAILSRTGTNVARDLEKHFGDSFSTNGLPQGGSATKLSMAGRGVDMGGNLRDGVDIDTSRVDPGNLATSYGNPADYAQQRGRVEAALMSRINPALDRDREGLRTSLINQGVGEGTEAFDRAMNRFGEQSNDARMQAILAGGEEQSRLAGLDRDRATFGNNAIGQQFGMNMAAQGQQNSAMGQLYGLNMQDASFNNLAVGQNFNQAQGIFSAQDAQRGQALNERLLSRNQPINEVSALLSGGQVNMPQFGAMPQFGSIPTTDYAGLVNANYQGQLQANANRGQVMGSLFGLGGTLGGASIMAGG